MRKSKKFVQGSIWDSNYGQLEILEYINKSKILIKFLNTGYERYTSASNIHSGSVRDVYYPTVVGVGFLGETTVSVNGKVKSSYHVWRGMLYRCYDIDNYAPTYFNIVVVCEDWKCYAVFEKWYDENYVDGFYLDKDLTVLDCKIYSPETCCFIPNKLNCILGRKDLSKAKVHKNLPVGVSYHVRDEKYTSQCFDGDKLQHFGYHDTPEEAFSVYKTFKESLLKTLAEDYYTKGIINQTVYDNLINYEVKPYFETCK